MYWSSRGLSITVTGPDGTTTVQLSKPFARVGSREGSEVLLTRAGISGRAAYIHATDRGIWCCSLARSGAEPAKLQRIRPGTGVHLGPYRLSVEFADADSTGDAPPVTALSAKADEGLELQFVSANNKSSVGHVLNRTFTIIGRGRPSNITLDDDRLSRVHCLLYRQGKELWVIDLLSQNGTRLGGRRTEAVSVLPGERVVIGGYALSYSVRGPQRHKEVRPPPPIIVEQTIVREQIVTRLVAHSSSLVVPPGGSTEQANTSLESFFETIGDLARSAADSSRMASPPQQIGIPDSASPPLLTATVAETSDVPSAEAIASAAPVAEPIAGDQPVAITTDAPSLAATGDESQVIVDATPSLPLIADCESPAISDFTQTASTPVLDELVEVSEPLTTPTHVESVEPVATTSLPPAPLIFAGDLPPAITIAPPPAPSLAHDESEPSLDSLPTSSELDTHEPPPITSPAPPPPPLILTGYEPATTTASPNPPPVLVQDAPDATWDHPPIPAQLEITDSDSSTDTSSWPPPLTDLDLLAVDDFAIPPPLPVQDDPDTAWDDLPILEAESTEPEPITDPVFSPPMVADEEPLAIADSAIQPPTLAQDEPDTSWNDLPILELESTEPEPITDPVFSPPMVADEEPLAIADSATPPPALAQDEPDATWDDRPLLELESTEPDSTTDPTSLALTFTDLDLSAIDDPTTPSAIAQNESVATWDDLTISAEMGAPAESADPLISSPLITDDELPAIANPAPPEIAPAEPLSMSGTSEASIDFDSSEPPTIAASSSSPAWIKDDEPHAIGDSATPPPPLEDDVASEVTETSSVSAPFFESDPLAMTDTATEEEFRPPFQSVQDEAAADAQADFQKTDPSSTGEPEGIIETQPDGKSRAPLPKAMQSMPAEASMDDPRSQVLDRLIDISTQQAGQARRRALLIGALLIVAIALAATGWYFFNQAVSGGSAP